MKRSVIVCMWMCMCMCIVALFCSCGGEKGESPQADEQQEGGMVLTDDIDTGLMFANIEFPVGVQIKKYVVSEVGFPSPRSLLIDFDVTRSAGLKEKVKSVGGVTSVLEREEGSDTHYSLWISPRVAIEDIPALRDIIVAVCEEHASADTGGRKKQ